MREALDVGRWTLSTTAWARNLRAALVISWTLALAAVVAPSSAGAPPSPEPSPSSAVVATDAKGWRAATWGMTESQVLEAFPGEVVRMEKPGPPDPHGTRATLTIPRFEIARADYAVNFGFDKDGALSFVGLVSAIKPTNEAAFETLRNLLTERYGAPTTEDRTRIKRQAIWRLPHTVIDLTLLRLAAGTIEVVSVSYAPPSAEGGKL
jgi:hypothetical protein